MGFKPLKIGNLELANPLILAPLAGVSNLPFRLLAKKYGAAMVCTEMISAAGLTQRGPKTRALMASSEEERPLSVQLFGGKVDWMKRAAIMAEEAGADVIDINMGCPVRKVVRSGAGSALLKDFRLIEKMLTEVRKAVKTPLTVKTRLGWKEGDGEIFDLVPILIDTGVDAVVLHARWAVQKFSGRADWSAIAKLVEMFPGPVIGNGDIKQPIHALRMLKETGCAGVMIGRAAQGKPWIFRQALDFLEGRQAAEPTLKDRLETAAAHAKAMEDLYGPDKAVYMLRSIFMWYTKGLPGSAAFRGKFTQIHKFDEMMESLEDFFVSLENENLFLFGKAENSTMVDAGIR